MLHDWQLSGVLTAGSAARDDINVTSQNHGTAVNPTGSPDYNARIVYVGAATAAADMRNGQVQIRFSF